MLIVLLGDVGIAKAYPLKQKPKKKYRIVLSQKLVMKSFMDT